jgi:hypothetical protein
MTAHPHPHHRALHAVWRGCRTVRRHIGRRVTWSIGRYTGGLRRNGRKTCGRAAGRLALASSFASCRLVGGRRRFGRPLATATFTRGRFSGWTRSLSLVVIDELVVNDDDVVIDDDLGRWRGTADRAAVILAFAIAAIVNARLAHLSRGLALLAHAHSSCWAQAADVIGAADTRRNI